MVDPIKITTAPTFTTFAVLSTDDPKTEPTKLSGRKGVLFRNAASANVWFTESVKHTHHQRSAYKSTPAQYCI
jgi:hypothetical protein